jgi:endonuclease/exonuclease/phosphatase family metal-dependent hydrolase
MIAITWNCNGAFRKKFRKLEYFDADIMVIQECEDPERSKDEIYKNWATNFLWTGENKNKGLGIFCKNNIKLINNNWNTNSTKHFISAKINNNFDIVAVWNHHANSPNFRYIGQFWKYLQINKGLMKNPLILGDFNSNKIWDEWDRWWNHSDVVRELDEMGLRSLYHEYYDEEQGSEKQPTFYLQRNIVKPYHIDYIFACKTFFHEVKRFQVGDQTNWLELSDHLPLAVEFQEN